MPKDLYQRVRELIIERLIAEELYEYNPCITLRATIIANTQELDHIRLQLVSESKPIVPESNRDTIQLHSLINRGLQSTGVIIVDPNGVIMDESDEVLTLMVQFGAERLKVQATLCGSYSNRNVRLDKIEASMDKYVTYQQAKFDRLHRERRLTKQERRRLREQRQKANRN